MISLSSQRGRLNYSYVEYEDTESERLYNFPTGTQQKWQSLSSHPGGLDPKTCSFSSPSHCVTNTVDTFCTKAL